MMVPLNGPLLTCTIMQLWGGTSRGVWGRADARLKWPPLWAEDAPPPFALCGASGQAASWASSTAVLGAGGAPLPPSRSPPNHDPPPAPSSMKLRVAPLKPPLPACEGSRERVARGAGSAPLSALPNVSTAQALAAGGGGGVTRGQGLPPHLSLGSTRQHSPSPQKRAFPKKPPTASSPPPLSLRHPRAAGLLSRQLQARAASSQRFHSPACLPAVPAGRLAGGGVAPGCQALARTMPPPVTGQPQATISPATQSSEGSWSSGRCDFCSDCPMCCVGFCCPMVLGCYVSHKYGEHWCLGLVPGGMTALRTHMRLAYGIPGTVIRDALSMFLCGWCELCRMGREVSTRSRSQKAEAGPKVGLERTVSISFTGAKSLAGLGGSLRVAQTKTGAGPTLCGTRTNKTPLKLPRVWGGWGLCKSGGRAGGGSMEGWLGVFHTWLSVHLASGRKRGPSDIGQIYPEVPASSRAAFHTQFRFFLAC
ncbi:uncharacterized protein LOC128333308 [Hemicordylus capensis]|uniref:uncharacterized protein LOC128333308 n=1 Tax=Hemicordylus capensis TaxID=884348 RepID=UPI0023021A25|nr:uncharacterized protein LOC128333308 [Hemicordylus capensis]